MAGAKLDRETLIGAAVVVVGGVVLAFAYGGSARPSTSGYDLEARFAKAEGIGIGAPVRLSGIDVGTVVGQKLDARFRALLTLRIAPGVQLPTDSAALIETDGLLGAKFVAIQPGSDETNLKPGTEFRYTQSSMNLGDILELIISQAEAKHGGAPPADMGQ